MSHWLWRWPTPLVEGRLVRRYERFVAEVDVPGRGVVRAHCVNPGRMEGLVFPGARVWLSEAQSDRAMRWTWELIELDGVLVGANTNLPNRLVGALLEHARLGRAAELGLTGAFWRGIRGVRPEQLLAPGHRVDFVLERDAGPHYVEVKNCHLVYPDRRGYFPDSRSERAARHALALAEHVRHGARATVLFTLQRTDVDALRPSALHDPDFAAALREAVRDGVTVHAVRLEPTLEGLRLDAEVPVDVEEYDVAQVQRFAEALAPASGWLRKDGKVAGATAPGAAPVRAAKPNPAAGPARSAQRRGRRRA